RAHTIVKCDWSSDVCSSDLCDVTSAIDAHSFAAYTGSFAAKECASMAEVTSHPTGAFSWPELSTTDQKGAVAFYRALFGWDVNRSEERRVGERGGARWDVQK